MRDYSKYFNKHHIIPEHVLTVRSSGRHTILSLDSGEEISTTIPMYEIMSLLSQEDFITISRGISVRSNSIISISDSGIYTLINGATFQGRKRHLSDHKKLRTELGLDANTFAQKAVEAVAPLPLWEKCSILDDMPIAYCIIELVFDEFGHGIDFIFRYCNNQMAVLEGIPIEDMVNHSFYEVFKNGDKKWLITYADVALNGTKRSIKDYSTEIDKQLTIHCYQPEPGYCACILFAEE